MMPRWLSAWLDRRPVIDTPDYSPCVNAFGQICLPSDYAMLASKLDTRECQTATYVIDTGRISAVPASFSDPQTAASALSRHGHNKARAKIRAKCDEMNAALGRPPIVWL